MPSRKISSLPMKLRIKYEAPSRPIRTIIGRSSLAERKNRLNDANVGLLTFDDDDM
jgi:hypothetical protein